MPCASNGSWKTSPPICTSCTSCKRSCARATGRSLWPSTWAIMRTGRASCTSGPASTTARSTVLAVDLGSTTIAAHLCDLQTGEVVASSGVMNPQIRFGEDLMSRVSYSMMNASGAEEMTQRRARGHERALHADSRRRRMIDKQLIVDAVFVCNPVMHHLFLGHRSVRAGAGTLCAGHLQRHAPARRRSRR